VNNAISKNEQYTVHILIHSALGNPHSSSDDMLKESWAWKLDKIQGILIRFHDSVNIINTRIGWISIHRETVVHFGLIHLLEMGLASKTEARHHSIVVIVQNDLTNGQNTLLVLVQVLRIEVMKWLWAVWMSIWACEIDSEDEV